VAVRHIVISSRRKTSYRQVTAWRHRLGNNTARQKDALRGHATIWRKISRHTLIADNFHLFERLEFPASHLSNFCIFLYFFAICKTVRIFVNVFLSLSNVNSENLTINFNFEALPTSHLPVGINFHLSSRWKPGLDLGFTLFSLNHSNQTRRRLKVWESFPSRIIKSFITRLRISC
jgi:hypothetical protein